MSMSTTTTTLAAIELNTYIDRYDYTIGLRRRDWAWEFLRRNPEFAAMAYTHQSKVQISNSCIPQSKILHLYEPLVPAHYWGLIFFPNPDMQAPAADVFWLPHLDPAIVSVIVSRRRSDERDEMRAAIDECAIDVLRDPNGTEHLLTRGKYSTAQSICSGFSLLHAREPVKVNLDMRGPGRMEHAFSAYKQAEEILHNGPWRWTSRTQRLRNALICLDVKDAGLPLRSAAEIIFGAERVADQWPNNKQFREQVRGYYRTGQTLRLKGYKQLLQGAPLEAMD
jgi:hypothetical protein